MEGSEKLAEASVLVRVLQRNRDNRICVYREKFVLRNWVPVIVES